MPKPMNTEVPIEIDKKPYEAPKPEMRGDELKALASVPGDYQLFLDTPPGQGDDLLIPNDFVVQLKPGMKFHSVPPGNVGGGSHTGFPLLDQDIEQLQELGYRVRIHPEPGEWVILILEDFKLPPHYSKPSSALLIKVPPGYRAARPDMFWLEPDLRLKNGSVPAGGSTETILGAQWLRFSWHPQSWHPEKDTLLTYLNFIRARLRMEN